MGLQFASLGSGSRGNAALIRGGGTCIMLDAGFPARELEQRCRTLKVEPTEIDAILVTHEHGDHIRGVGPFSRRHQTPVWMTHGTWRTGKCGELPSLNLLDGHDRHIAIGDIHVQPYAVPHDARQPTQYTFSLDGFRFGVLTDVGSITSHIVEALDGMDALLLECNHDLEMLVNGPYPPSLQERVGGDYGHLNNHQAAELLSRLDHGRLQHLFLGHLSEKNNRPELAKAAVLSRIASLEERLTVLTQDHPTTWLTLG